MMGRAHVLEIMCSYHVIPSILKIRDVLIVACASCHCCGIADKMSNCAIHKLLSCSETYVNWDVMVKFTYLSLQHPSIHITPLLLGTLRIIDAHMDVHI